jgi:hypothetical protein
MVQQTQAVEDLAARRWWQRLSEPERVEHLDNLFQIFLDTYRDSHLPEAQKIQRLVEMRASLQETCGDAALAHINFRLALALQLTLH